MKQVRNPRNGAEMTFREISETLGISKENAQIALFNGLAKLRGRTRVQRMYRELNQNPTGRKYGSPDVYLEDCEV